MKDTQQNMRRTTIHRIFIVGLLLIFGVGQMLAVDYSPYKGKTRRTHGGIYSTAEAAKDAAGMPMLGFQTTSTMYGGTRSDASTPLVNGDGSVAAGAYAGIPTRANAPGNGPGTPPIPNPDDQQVPTPIGDTLLPLLLLAIAFAAGVYYRRHRTITTKSNRK